MWNNKISFLPVKRRAKKRTEIIFSLNSCCASACCVYFFRALLKRELSERAGGGKSSSENMRRWFSIEFFFFVCRTLEGVEIPSRTNSFSKARKNIKHYWAKCLRPELLSTDLKDHRSKWLLLLNSLSLTRSSCSAVVIVRSKKREKQFLLKCMKLSSFLYFFFHPIQLFL